MIQDQRLHFLALPVDSSSAQLSWNSVISKKIRESLSPSSKNIREQAVSSPGMTPLKIQWDTHQARHFDSQGEQTMPASGPSQTS